jgi:hypothetical protein
MQDWGILDSETNLDWEFGEFIEALLIPLDC